MSPQTDRRIQRTRALLHRSLMDLLGENGYDSISIQAITDHANLARATFYLHYTDKDELLIECMEELVDQFIQRISMIPVESWALRDGAPLVQVFEYAEEQAQLYRIIMSSKVGMDVSRRLHTLIASNTKRVLESQIIEKGVVPLLDLDFICNYFAGSLLSLVFWWLENDMPYSAETLANMVRQISLYGRANAMGLAEQ